MKVKTKLLATVGVVTIMLVGLGIMVSHQTTALESLKNGQVMAKQLDVEMLRLRHHERDYLASKEAKHLDAFGTVLADVQKTTDRLSNLLVEHGIDTGAVAEVRSHIDDHARQFRSLAGAPVTDDKLDALHSTGRMVEERNLAMASVLGDEVAAIEDSNRATLYGTLVAIVLLVAVWLSWLAFDISRRVTRIAHGMCEIARGDGDLTRRLKADGNDEFTRLAGAYNEFASRTHDTLKKVAELTAGLGQTGGQLTDAATSTTDSMHQLQGSTQTVVVATEELASTAQQVAGSAGEVSSSTHEADAMAKAGRETVELSIQAINSFASEFNEAASTINALRAETDNIGGILDVIRSIAEQTNLLALNAAIEAARAGEQGRGFAVVADEVRSLAHRSQTSTNEIQDLIVRLQEQAESAVNKIQHGHERISDTVTQAEQAGEALTRITTAVEAINGMTLQIATAAEQQSSVVAEISSNIATIDNLARETAGDADSTTHLTGKLSKAMSDVTLEIRHFRFENDEQLVLEQAKTAHLAWKGRLRDFLDGTNLLTKEQVVSHKHCDLGKWYYSEGVQQFGDVSEFRAIESPHEKIHRLIHRVVELKESGDKAGAEAAFQEVTTLSGDIVGKIEALKNAVK